MTSLPLAADPSRPMLARLAAYARRWVDSLDWRPQEVTVARSVCQSLSLDMAGVPRRMQASSISLQLQHLTGFGRPGFAWKNVDGAAEVWVWDEQALLDAGRLPAAATISAGVMPVPEMLYRPPLEDGLHLVECREGFEALSIAGRLLNKTRWFAGLPEASAWLAFVRDSGRDPAQFPLPSPVRLEPSRQMQGGWRVQTTLSNRLSAKFWVALIVVGLAGAGIAVALSYHLRLAWQAAEARAEYRQLAHEHAELIALNRRIGEQRAFLDTLASVREPVSQLLLMKSLADAGIFGSETRISLLEWEYRNARLRLLFSVPPDNFSLSLFLAALENQGGFREVRLMPDTPPLTVGVQMRLASVAPETGPAGGAR